MLAAVAFVTATQGIPLSQFPWWQLDFAGMMRDGVLVGLPNHREMAPAGAFRYVSAITVNSACSHFQELADFIPTSARSVALGREDGSGMERTRRTLLRYADRLPLLVGEFDKELRQLGVDIPDVQTNLRRTTLRLKQLRIPEPGEALTRFPDVPRGHWAGKAVHNLRREGVIWGYPDGTFQGGPVRATPSVAWREEFEKLAKADFFIRPEAMTPPMDHNRFTASLQAVSFYKTVEDLIELALSEKGLQAALRSIALDEKGIQTRPSACYRDLATAYHSDLTFLESESTNFRHLANLILLLAPEIDINPVAPRTAMEMYFEIGDMLVVVRNLRIPEVGEGKGQP